MANKRTKEPDTSGAELVIEYVDPRTLVPDPKNPRQITPEKRARLKRGIERFGFVLPFLARAEDRQVIGGHQRLSIALETETPLVPVIFRSQLTRAEAKAIGVLLNNPNAQGEWAAGPLADFLSEIKAEDFDLTLTGFDDADIARLLGDFDASAVESGGGKKVKEFATQYFVMVECRDERHQQAVYAKLVEGGHVCRIIT